MEARIYSLNKACYCIMKGRTDYKIVRDIDYSDRDVFFLIFNSDVSDLIDEYNKNQIIQNYNHSYKRLRSQIKQIRLSERIEV